MLTITALRRLKPKERDYKISDRDSMYAVVKPSGVIIFRYDYRLNGRRETLTIGRFGPDGTTRREVAGTRKAAQEAASEGGQKFRRFRRALDNERIHGGQHPHHAPHYLRQGYLPSMEEPSTQ